MTDLLQQTYKNTVAGANRFASKIHNILYYNALPTSVAKNNAPANSVSHLSSPGHVGSTDMSPQASRLGRRLLRMFCLRHRYGSRLGNASLAACMHVSPVVSGSPKGLPPLRTKHANANKFALLSASAYVCIRN